MSERQITRLHIRPVRSGVKIKDPHTRRTVPDDGGWVPKNSYYVRSIRRGDAEECEPGAKRGGAVPAPVIEAETTPNPGALFEPEVEDSEDDDGKFDHDESPDSEDEQ